MAGDATVAAADPTVHLRGAGAAGWIRLRFALMLVLVCLVVCAGVVGNRSATLSELKTAIVAGHVHEVRANGALEPGTNGFTHVRLFWQDGPISRVTTVMEQSDAAALPPAQFPNYEHVVGDLLGDLRRLDGAGSLQVRADYTDLSSGPTIAGWQLPAWFGLVLVVVWLAVIALLVQGPDPWWATRWAWFWIVFSPLAPVAVPLFLLACGPPPGVQPAENLGRRLTGGWAFLIVGGVVRASQSLG